MKPRQTFSTDQLPKFTNQARMMFSAFPVESVKAKGSFSDRGAKGAKCKSPGQRPGFRIQSEASAESA
jgi:hypothetical protein